MGKATIASGGAGGNYTIGLDFGTATRSATLAAIAAYLAQLAPKIADAQTKYNTQKNAEEAIKSEVEGDINGYVAAHQALAAAASAENAALVHFEEVANNPLSTDVEKLQSQTQLTAAMAAHTVAKNAIQPALDAYTKAAAKLTDERKKTAALMLPLQNLKDDQAGRLKEQTYWAGIVTSATQQAWCADLTEDAGGEVSTIEIPGEGNIILIAPGAPAPSAADGVLRAREVQSPEQVFFNAAILPGWQKFKPTYRRGVITALDTESNTASVTLIDDKSSAQGLGINKVSTLTNVPVVYMICHANAFDVGDACVVKFADQDWAKPKVVGFVSNPKPCMPRYIYVGLQKIDVLAEPTGTRNMMYVYSEAFFEAGYISSMGPETVRVLSHHIATAGLSTSATTITGYTINCSPSALHTYETNFNVAAGWAPPGAMGYAYGITIDVDGVQVVQTTRSVNDETHRFYSERFTGPDHTGAVYQPDQTTIYLTNGGNPGKMLAHTFVRDVLGVVPLVSLNHDDKTYAYALESSIGSTLVYAYSGLA